MKFYPLFECGGIQVRSSLAIQYPFQIYFCIIQQAKAETKSRFFQKQINKVALNINITVQKLFKEF